MLETMRDFFENRLAGYDAHMKTAIAAADEFYPFTARCLPAGGPVRVLDLGCGTGLELEAYFRLNPTAQVTGIDLSPGMLAALRAKFPDRALTLITGSYFDTPFGEGAFDAAVSVESLHHFTAAEKVPLYARLRAALKADGCFILTDYFALSQEEEQACRQQLQTLKAQQELAEDVFYHYDTPLTVPHECAALRAAGFSAVEVLGAWGATHTLRARR